MCMGYAKDIKAWACPQEISRRDAAVSLWGEMLRDASDAASMTITEPEGGDSVVSRPGTRSINRPDLSPSLDMTRVLQDA